MKDEIVYRKQGRRYVPIGICDAAASYWPEGAHLVVIEPGRRTTRYHVEPAMAALEAAARKMQDGMVQAMQKASAAVPQKGRKQTAKELQAWEAYKAIAGDVQPLWLEYASMQSIARAGIDAVLATMIQRTETKMTKPETLDQLRARLSTEQCGLETAVKDGITITYTPQELFGVDYKAFEDAVTQFANDWIAEKTFKDTP